MYSIERTKGTSFFRQFDYLLFITVLALSVFGLLILTSATYRMDNASGMLQKQLISLALGIMMALILSCIDYKDLKVLGIYLYVISVALLLYVRYDGWLLNGARSWIKLPGGLMMQPSEIAKIAFIICMAIFLERLKEGEYVKKNAIKLMIYCSIPIGLVLLQPDVGTASVFFVIILALLFVYGIKYRYFFIGAGAATVIAPIIWFSGLLSNERKERVLEFIYPGSGSQDSSFHIDRSEMAIGSGQIFGSGLFKGVQTQNGRVPYNESDFIFTVIGEELGFIGSVLLLVFVFMLLMRCFYIARNSRDHFGAFLVAGIAGMLGFHFIQNIGMCIRLMPITGIPLPFISNGGSAMVTNYIAIGIVLSVSMRRKRALFNASQ